jgi:hypothetical protein
MADNRITKMREELESAGYKIDIVSNRERYTSTVVSPDGWCFSFFDDDDLSTIFFESEKERKVIIEKAHAHLQEKRRATELEAFIRELAGYPLGEFSDDDSYEAHTSFFEEFQERAKALLGNKD